MNHASRTVRGLALLFALLGAAAFAGPKQETPAAGVDSDDGVLVMKVEVGSPAEAAGIVRGDIILSVDGVAAASAAEVQRAVAARKPGDTVTVTVLHGDAKRALSVRLGERSGRTYLGVYLEPGSSVEAQPDAASGAAAPSGPDTGPRLNAVPRLLAASGAQIVGVADGSPAAKAGLARGDVITAVDGKDIGSGDDLATLIGARKPGDTVVLEVLGTGGATREVKVILGENPQDAAKAWLGVEYRMAFRIEGSTPWAGRLPLTLGVRVAGVTDGSPAAKAGIEKGDLLTSLDGRAMLTARQVTEAIAARKPGDTVKIGVLRADGSEAVVEATLAGDPKDAAEAWLGVQLGNPSLVPGWRWDRSPGNRDPRGTTPGSRGGFGGTDA